jgi:hypothetical protein
MFLCSRAIVGVFQKRANELSRQRRPNKIVFVRHPLPAVVLKASEVIVHFKRQL